MRALLAPRAFLPRPVNRRDVTSRSAGDGEHAYDDPVDRALAVFWRNWTGNASCRHLVTASPRGSLWRSPEEIESRVRAWLEVFPPSPSGTCGAHGIDVPTIGTREPMTLLLTKAEAARAVVRAKTTLECGGRQITLAPGVLLIDEEKLGRAVRALRRGRRLALAVRGSVLTVRGRAATLGGDLLRPKQTILGRCIACQTSAVSFSASRSSRQQGCQGGA